MSPTETPTAPAPVDVYPIRFALLPRWVFTLAGLSPAKAAVSVSATELTVVFGWGFRLTSPITKLASATLRTSPVFELGVHGWNRRWIVNGSYAGLVELRFIDPIPAHIGGFSVRVSKLSVSLAAPEAFLASCNRFITPASRP
jgi:hypothetical protein